MTVMSRYPDKYFDLAVVDPPYGIGASAGTGEYSRRWLNNVDKYWDNDRPMEGYFSELFRISQNQIVWGGNYFDLPIHRGWICWYKSDEVKDRDFSEIELAWSSFDIPARHFEKKPFIRGGNRIHPTQKPLELYDWIFDRYAEQGMKILDTHGGSMSSVISADKAGLEMVCCELDKEYFDKAVDRFNKYKSQLRLAI